MAGLKKAGSNWVDGESFFDRQAELDLLTDRVRNGTHTLLTAQRRMGKTSLVRELLRRLSVEGDFQTVFVDLEDAGSAADAVAEIAVQSRPAQHAWPRIKDRFANVLRGVGDRIDAVSVAEVRVQLRAGIDAGSWRQKGDEVLAVLADLAEIDRPLVLAIDELPILVNRMLKDDDYRITPEGRRTVDKFLSWLRRNGQEHRGKICLIVSGSVGLEPILRQANLSALANIFSPFDLKPWNEQTALDCLAALAEGCGLDLPCDARKEMCRLLRCLVPHHVQLFFDSLDEYLAKKRSATPDDVARVYKVEMLGVRGQADLGHYEDRLKLVLGPEGYRDALDLLTEAAVNRGVLKHGAIARYRDYFQNRAAATVPIEDVLRVLEHDGYLEEQKGGYRFVSRLLKDWWRARYGRHFVSVAQRAARSGA